MTVSPMVWVGFNVGVILLLGIDALILNPKGKAITLQRAFFMCAFWLLLAMAFNLGVYFYLGNHQALEFLTAYVVEQSLSVDNLFVFMLIFSYFKISSEQQYKVLTWGILSAQVMRAIFILGGIALILKFHWLLYLMGAFLLFIGIKLFFKKEEGINPEDNIIIKWIGKRLPLFWIVLIVVETTDLIFAFDSIPAVLGITKNPFIAYTSNIFAILSLRAMYFAFVSFMKVFHYLHYGLGVILTFVGFKMVTEEFVHIPVLWALGFIILTLTLTAILSILCPPKSSQKS